MNWTEYKEMSEKTLSTEFHCGRQVEYLLHAVMGIITELEEVLEWKEDKVGKNEEMIDIMWYFAIIGREFNLELPEHIFRSDCKRVNDEIILNMYKKSSLLLDFLKKKIFYNSEIDDIKFIEIYNNLVLDSLDYCLINNIDIEKGFDTNIAKLKERYGEKFSSEKAINRNLVSERKILEEGI